MTRSSRAASTSRSASSRSNWTGLRKLLGWGTEALRACIDPDHPGFPVARQCELIGLSRSTYYYSPIATSDENLLLMRLIDEQFTATPFFGSPRMTRWLERHGHPVNHKKVERLMRVMALAAIAPKESRRRKDTAHVVYPYLLRDFEASKPNEVWSADITYIRLLHGFVHLVAVLDWYSRYVLA